MCACLGMSSGIIRERDIFTGYRDYSGNKGTSNVFTVKKGKLWFDGKFSTLIVLVMCFE